MENQGDGNFLWAIEVVLGWIESLKLVPVGCMRGERIKVFINLFLQLTPFSLLSNHHFPMHYAIPNN